MSFSTLHEIGVQSERSVVDFRVGDAGSFGDQICRELIVE